MAKRLVRAKAKIAHARIPYRVPPRAPAPRAHRRRPRRPLPAVQRGVHGLGGRRPRPAPTSADEAIRLARALDAADARRARSRRAAGADAVPARRGVWRALDDDGDARHARGAGSQRAGTAARSTRRQRSWIEALARQSAGPVPAAGRDRRVPRRNAAMRMTPTGRGSRRLYERLPQSCRQPVVALNHAVAVAMARGSGRGPRAGRRARRLGSAQRLPPAACDARRPAAPARPRSRGASGVPAGARAHRIRRRAAVPGSAPGRDSAVVACAHGPAVG